MFNQFCFQERADSELGMRKTGNTPHQSCEHRFTQNSPHILPVPAEHPFEASVCDNLGKTNLFNVSRHEENSGKENGNPSLESISYQQNQAVVGRSVVYTVDIPLAQLQQPIKMKEVESKPPGAKSARYISLVNVSIEQIGEEESVRSSESSIRIKSVGPVRYRKVTAHGEGDRDAQNERDVIIENIVPELNSASLESTQKARKSEKDTGTEIGVDGHVHKAKEEIVIRRKSKEALIAAKSQTADWLLNNDPRAVNIGRPNWASTPNLKNKKNYEQGEVKKRRFKKEAGHSFDLLLGEETENDTADHISSDMDKQSQRTVLSQYSGDGEYRDYRLSPHRRPHLQHLQGDSACSSMDESVDNSRVSMIGSSCGIPEDHLNYLRLARLVNGPSPIMVSCTHSCNRKLHFRSDLLQGIFAQIFRSELHVGD